MGMTDRQFDAYLKKMLRTLKLIKKEVQSSGNSVSEELDNEIKELEEQLRRP